MEPSDQSTSPTVFDLPPKETESLAAPAPDHAASTLRDGMDEVTGTVPGKPESGEPWFTKYVGAGGNAEERSGPVPDADPKPTTADEIPATPEAQKSGTDIATCPPAPLRPAAGSTARLPDAIEPAPESRRVSSKEELDKAAQLGLASRESGGLVTAARHSNLRRTAHMAKLVALTFVANVLVLGAAGYWLHKRLSADFEARIASLPAPQPPPPAPVIRVEPPATPAVAPEDLKKLEDSLRVDAGNFKTQIETALKRLADSEEQNRKQTVRLDELTASLSAAERTLADKKTSSAPVAATLPPDPGLPPTPNELVLLKERNRLTGYADEAIATGARAPYERLWETLDDPRLANLVHAARAEILRVQNYYLSGSRIERFDIPVATYYPENGALKDSQLKDDQLIDLLGAAKNPWEVRMKAANLLGMRRSMEIGDALVKAVKKDDNLDVVKEATFSFEQMTGFHAKIFDTSSLETWWKQYKATPPPPKPKAALQPKPLEEKEKPAAKPSDEDDKTKSAKP